MPFLRSWRRVMFSLLFATLMLSGVLRGLPPDDASVNLSFGIPSPPDQLLSRRGFSIGYGKKERQAIWVCYILTAETLELPRVARSNMFRPDPLVENPVYPRDYRKTGYDKGHLAPAADFTYPLPGAHGLSAPR